MITFYTACGIYKIAKDERGQKAPYIQTLGKLHAISIPEFVIWSNLLWNIMSYDDLKKNYVMQMQKFQTPIPDFDELLGMLVARRLAACGVGYTGVDALYDMLSGAFVIPHYPPDGRRGLFPALRSAWQGVLWCDSSNPEKRVSALIHQTPLSVAELTRCFDLNLRNVRTPDKLIAGLYLTSDQSHISAEQLTSPSKNIVLEAVANLYLHCKVYLEISDAVG